MTTTIFSTFAVEGFHRWPGAPQEHAYLASEHRHMFHVRVDVRVDDGDRAVEFIALGRIAQCLLRDGYEQHRTGAIDFGGASCEDIAASLLALLSDEGFRVASVAVSEDGENGAEVRP